MREPAVHPVDCRCGGPTCGPRRPFGWGLAAFIVLAGFTTGAKCPPETVFAAVAGMVR